MAIHVGPCWKHNRRFCRRFPACLKHDDHLRIFDVSRNKLQFPTELSGGGLLGEIGSDKTVLYSDVVSLQKGMAVSYTLLPVWLGVLISMVRSKDVGCTTYGSQSVW